MLFRVLFLPSFSFFRLVIGEFCETYSSFIHCRLFCSIVICRRTIFIPSIIWAVALLGWRPGRGRAWREKERKKAALMIHCSFQFLFPGNSKNKPPFFSFALERLDGIVCLLAARPAPSPSSSPPTLWALHPRYPAASPAVTSQRPDPCQNSLKSFFSCKMIEREIFYNIYPSLECFSRLSLSSEASEFPICKKTAVILSGVPTPWLYLD